MHIFYLVWNNLSYENKGHENFIQIHLHLFQINTSIFISAWKVRVYSISVSSDFSLFTFFSLRISASSFITFFSFFINDKKFRFTMSTLAPRNGALSRHFPRSQFSLSLSVQFPTAAFVYIHRNQFSNRSTVNKVPIGKNKVPGK